MAGIEKRDPLELERERLERERERPLGDQRFQRRLQQVVQAVFELDHVARRPDPRRAGRSGGQWRRGRVR